VESRATQKRKEKRKSEQKNIFEEDGETTEEESETESEKEKNLGLARTCHVFRLSHAPGCGNAEVRGGGRGIKVLEPHEHLFVLIGRPPSPNFGVGGINHVQEARSSSRGWLESGGG
jgi:hypothetical protein